MKNNNEILDYIFARLEKLRTDNDLSKQKMSESAGKHRNWYQQAEREKHDIGVVELIKLADHFGVKPSKLID